MSTIGHIKIDPSMPFLSGKDLAKEAEGMPVEEFDLGNGLSVQRQGIMVKLIGGNNLSPHAFMAALQASEMGGDVGRSMLKPTARQIRPISMAAGPFLPFWKVRRGADEKRRNRMRLEARKTLRDWRFIA